MSLKCVCTLNLFSDSVLLLYMMLVDLYYNCFIQRKVGIIYSALLQVM